MSNEEERRKAFGSHFSISVQRVREMKQRISAVIEEQNAYQKLVSAALLKEKLKAELALHDKLSDESVSRLRYVATSTLHFHDTLLIVFVFFTVVGLLKFCNSSLRISNVERLRDLSCCRIYAIPSSTLRFMT
jgi:hypothetical protein